jgi:hypothetical protein
MEDSSFHSLQNEIDDKNRWHGMVEGIVKGPFWLDCE